MLGGLLLDKPRHHRVDRNPLRRQLHCQRPHQSHQRRLARRRRREQHLRPKPRPLGQKRPHRHDPRRRSLPQHRHRRRHQMQERRRVDRQARRPPRRVQHPDRPPIGEPGRMHRPIHPPPPNHRRFHQPGRRLRRAKIHDLDRHLRPHLPQLHSQSLTPLSPLPHMHQHLLPRPSQSPTNCRPDPRPTPRHDSNAHFTRCS